VELYNFLLSHRQSWMRYYYNFIEFIKPNDNPMGYLLSAGYGKRLLACLNPAVVVSLHPMVNHYLARIIKSTDLPHEPKLIVVMTDPNGQFWSGWACKDADLTIAPNDLARERLLSLGLDPARILTIGMPVHPCFLRTPTESRETLLERMALNPNVMTICLAAGWGGGNVSHIYEALRSVKTPIQVIAATGTCERLRHWFERQERHCLPPTIVLPDAILMSDCMSACDLLVTKAGGLTVFEAIARHLPMAIDMIGEPMPQEIGTAEMLIAAGLAQPIRTPQDIVPIVESLKRSDDKKTKSLPEEHNLDRVNAVYDIARTILSNCHFTPEAPPASDLVARTHWQSSEHP